MAAKTSPSANGVDRTSKGRFRKGYKGGPGNPHAKAVARLRSQLYSAVTDEDLEAVTRGLIAQAKAGNVPAIKELYDRLFGKSMQPIAADMGDVVIRVITGLDRASQDAIDVPTES